MTGVCIGLISDTHGLVRAAALEAMDWCDAIIHAGDVGSADVLRALQRIAPVYAICGNVDRGAWAGALPDTLELELAGARIRVLHDLKQLEGTTPNVDVVVAGHSHVPQLQQKAGILFINPGSAGPRRFHLPVSVGYLHVVDGAVRGELRALG